VLSWCRLFRIFMGIKSMHLRSNNESKGFNK
jgi:hypothetical protein